MTSKSQTSSLMITGSRLIRLTKALPAMLNLAGWNLKQTRKDSLAGCDRQFPKFVVSIEASKTSVFGMRCSDTGAESLRGARLRKLTVRSTLFLILETA